MLHPFCLPHMVQEALFINFVIYYLVHFFTNTFLNTKMGKARISGKLTLKVAPCSSSFGFDIPPKICKERTERGTEFSHLRGLSGQENLKIISHLFLFFFDFLSWVDLPILKF